MFNILLPLWEIAVKIDRAHGCRRLDGRIVAAVNCVIDLDNNQVMIFPDMQNPIRDQWENDLSSIKDHVLKN